MILAPVVVVVAMMASAISCEEETVASVMREVLKLQAQYYNYTVSDAPLNPRSERKLTLQQAKSALNNLKMLLKIPIDDVDVQGFAADAPKWNLPLKYAYEDGQFDESTKNKIRIGVKAWSDTTCVTFQEVEKSELAGSSEPSVLITNKKDGGCNSLMGALQPMQAMSIEVPGCDSLTTIAHEFAHALGMDHEQCRADRDKYIKIIWSNIEKDNHDQFTIAVQPDLNYDAPYDYNSVMQYDYDSFSVEPGLVTMQRLDGQDPKTLGNHDKPSFWDVKRMNFHYDCMQKLCGDRASAIKCSNGGYVNPKTCNSCNCPPSHPNCQEGAEPSGGGSPAGNGGTTPAPGGKGNGGNAGSTRVPGSTTVDPDEGYAEAGGSRRTGGGSRGTGGNRGNRGSGEHYDPEGPGGFGGNRGGSPRGGNGADPNYPNEE